MDEQTKQNEKISWVGDLHSSSSCHYYHIPLFFDDRAGASESMEPTLMVHTGSSETVMHMRKKNHNAAILSCFIRKMK